MKKSINVLLILSSLLFVLCGCTNMNVNTNTEKKLIAHNDYIENLYGKVFFENCAIMTIWKKREVFQRRQRF